MSHKSTLGRGENVSEGSKKKARRYHAPTVNEILSDELTTVASEYWAVAPGIILITTKFLLLMLFFRVQFNINCGLVLLGIE